MKNQPKGYVENKENIKLPKINDKSYLQKRGADILNVAKKYESK